MKKLLPMKDLLMLHEAWFEIAKRIESGEETWICNAASWLFRDKRISKNVLDEILRRVGVERKRQGVEGSALWRHADAYADSGRALRIRFIASELRML
jgi:hypothetical protein